MTDWQRTIVVASVLAALCGHSAVAAEPKLIGDTTIVVDSLTGAARSQIHLWSDAAAPAISLSAVVNSAKPSNPSVPARYERRRDRRQNHQPASTGRRHGGVDNCR
jgi:hypothetical protein